MGRSLAAVAFVAAAGTVVSCVPATLGGNGGGASDAAATCTGTMVPERCYRACDGAVAPPNGGACPDGYEYSPAHCAHVTLELIANTCGADAAADGGDASGGGGGGGAGGGTAGGPGGAGGAAGGSGPGCTDLVNDAPPAVQQFHMEVRPDSELGVGGVFADGVYDLSVIDYYGTARTSAAGAAITGTVRISNGGTRMEAVTKYEQGNVVTAEVRTLATSGTQVTETGTCPVWGPNTEDYFATPTRFMLSNPMTVSRYALRAN